MVGVKAELKTLGSILIMLSHHHIPTMFILGVQTDPSPRVEKWPLPHPHQALSMLTKDGAKGRAVTCEQQQLGGGNKPIVSAWFCYMVGLGLVLIP